MVGSPEPIQVFVISYNLVSPIPQLVNNIIRMGGQVFIVDNASTYGPLLEWYETLAGRNDIHVIKMSQNFGPHVVYNQLAFFRETYQQITGKTLPDEFVITDSDLDLSGIPDDGLRILYKIREEDKKGQTQHIKIGFGLVLEDLPINKHTVRTRQWKPTLCRNPAVIADIPVYVDSLIDTTLHLFMSQLPRKSIFGPAIRTGKPYQARHLPWYWAENDVDEKVKYYLSRINTSYVSHSTDLKRQFGL